MSAPSKAAVAPRSVDQLGNARTTLSPARLFRDDVLRLSLSLCAILLIVWSPYFFAGKTLLASASTVPSIYPAGAGGRDPGLRVLPSLDPGAPAWVNEPWLALQHRLLFHEHVLPMWNPYGGYGTPFAASMQAAPFSPLSVAVATHPSPWLYNLVIVGRLFIVGLGCALFVRLFCGFAPALIAGICGAFSSYFLLYLQIGHVTVESMLPWSLIGVELIVRRVSAVRIAILTAAWALTVLGGMPESAALSGLVVGSYALFRVFVARGSAPALPRLLAIGCGLGVGTMIAGIMVVPFLEYLKNDFDVHQAHGGTSPVGGSADTFSVRLLLTEFAPLAFGPPWNNILMGFSHHDGTRGAPGTFAILCGLVALTTAVLSYRRRLVVDRVVLFMAVMVMLFEAKRYGAPFINWIGSLPVLQLIQFSKYEEAPIAVLCACLAGFGAAAVLEKRAGRVAVGIAILLVLGAVTWSYDAVPVPEPTPHAVIYYGAFAFALAILAVTATSMLYAVARGNQRGLAAVLACVALAEGTGAFLVPILYVADKPASSERNPYAGAPYIRYLQSQTAMDGLRVMGIDGMLYPNWASAFGLYDVRDLDAMYPQRYLPFVAAFLFPVKPTDVKSTDEEGLDRFTGKHPIDFSSESARRWMALSSIRYVVSPKPVASRQNAVLNALWAQTGPTVPAVNLSGVRLSTIEINGSVEATLFEHPPYDAVRYSSVIARQHPWFAVDLALDPSVWHECGGAVNFRIDALNASGTIVTSATRTIDPKHNAAEQRFIPLTLDLRKQIGRSVTLAFATSVPPPGDTCAAWANWGEPRWTAALDHHPFRSSPDPTFLHIPEVVDAYVYRVGNSLARVALFHNVKRAATGDEALTALTDPHFDVTRTAVVEGAAPDASGDSRGDGVIVVERTSQRVDVDVTTASPALLLQNDTWYPGWKATVDGQDTPLVVADYLFRGVAVPAGRHRVVIAYRSTAVAIGLTLSLIGIVALLCICGLEVIERRKARRANAF